MMSSRKQNTARALFSSEKHTNEIRRAIASYAFYQGRVMKIIAIISHVLCCALYVCRPFVYLIISCSSATIIFHQFPTKLLSSAIQFVHFYSNSCRLLSDFLFLLKNAGAFRIYLFYSRRWHKQKAKQCKAEEKQMTARAWLVIL